MVKLSSIGITHFQHFHPQKLNLTLLSFNDQFVNMNVLKVDFVSLCVRTKEVHISD